MHGAIDPGGTTVEPVSWLDTSVVEVGQASVEVADAIWVVVDMERECRLTAEFRGRPRTLQHTGARR